MLRTHLEKHLHKLFPKKYLTMISFMDHFVFGGFMVPQYILINQEQVKQVYFKLIFYGYLPEVNRQVRFGHGLLSTLVPGPMFSIYLA